MTSLTGRVELIAMVPGVGRRSVPVDIDLLWAAFAASNPDSCLESEINYLTRQDGWNDLGFTRHNIVDILVDNDLLFGIPKWVYSLCLFRSRILRYDRMGQAGVLYEPNPKKFIKQFHKKPYFPSEHLVTLAEQIKTMANKLKDPNSDMQKDLINDQVQVSGPGLGGVTELHENIDFSYDQDKHLASGSFGDVFRGKYPIDSPHYNVAFKRFRFGKPTDAQLESFKTEVQCLQNLHQPNVLSMFGICTQPSLGILMELMAFSLGSVARNVQRHLAGPRLLFGRTALNIALGIARGLNYLHTPIPTAAPGPDSGKPRILHRDIKCDNILVSYDLSVVKVADFGLARFTQAFNTVTSAKGTSVYTAPEILWNRYTPLDQHVPYDEKIDVYSYGMLLYEMVSGQHPFSDIKVPEVNMNNADYWAADQIYHHQLRPDVTTLEQRSRLMDAHTNDCLIAIMKWCWVHRSTERPSMADVVSCLEATSPISYIEQWKAARTAALAAAAPTTTPTAPATLN